MQQVSEECIFLTVVKESRNKQAVLYGATFRRIQRTKEVIAMTSKAKYVVGKGVKFERIRRITGYL